MKLTNPVLWIFAAAIFNAFAAYFTLREQDRQTNELRGWMTGADSYAYFEPLRRDGRLAYYIRHTGSYPAYDVVVRVGSATEDELTASVVPSVQQIAGITRTLTCPVVHI